MRKNPQKTADLFTSNKDIPSGKLLFCAVRTRAICRLLGGVSDSKIAF